MKVIKKKWVLDKDLVQQTLAERRILKDAQHPFIVQLRYAFQNRDKLYLVMDYYAGGSLRAVMRRRKRFSISRSQFYLAEIFLAISHMHTQDIVYRDLKLENVVVTSDGHVACTDFGLSKAELSDSEKTKSFVGTCEYIAPEIIKKEGYGKPVDWWAFGILAYEMIEGDSPFKHRVPKMLFDKVLKEEPEFSGRFTEEAKDLISQLLTKDPSKRLGCRSGSGGVDEIKNHPFFKGIDWDLLYQKKHPNAPEPPHESEMVSREKDVSRAIANMLNAREEILPDSPLPEQQIPLSPSLRKKSDEKTFEDDIEEDQFARFSYRGSIFNRQSLTATQPALRDSVDMLNSPEAVRKLDEEYAKAVGTVENRNAGQETKVSAA